MEIASGTAGVSEFDTADGFSVNANLPSEVVVMRDDNDTKFTQESQKETAVTIINLTETKDQTVFALAGEGLKLAEDSDVLYDIYYVQKLQYLTAEMRTIRSTMFVQTNNNSSNDNSLHMADTG